MFLFFICLKKGNSSKINTYLKNISTRNYFRKYLCPSKFKEKEVRCKEIKDLPKVTECLTQKEYIKVYSHNHKLSENY